MQNKNPGVKARGGGATGRHQQQPKDRRPLINTFPTRNAPPSPRTLENEQVVENPLSQKSSDNSPPPTNNLLRYGQRQDPSTPPRNVYRGAFSSAQPRPTPAYNPSTTSSGSSESGFKRSHNKAIMRTPNQNWALEQELKVRVFGIPRTCWTAEVHKALSQYGTIVRIEMTDGTMDFGAFVTFQPPLRSNQWMNFAHIGGAKVRIETVSPFVRTVTSPVDRSQVYQEINILYANSLDFGVSLSETTMMKLHTVMAPQQVQVSLDLTRKKLSLKFPLAIDGVVFKYKFELPIALLQRIYKGDDKETGQCTLVIPFHSAPRFFRFAHGNQELEPAFSPSEKVWTDRDAWYRQTDVVDNAMKSQLTMQPVMHMKNAPIIDIGRWTTYRLSFNRSLLTGSKFHEFVNALSDHGITMHTEKEYTLREKSPAPLWEVLQEEIYTTHPQLVSSSSSSWSLTKSHTKFTFDDLFDSQIYLSFPIRYQLEACLSNGYLKEHTITRAFLERLANAPEALSLLEKVMDKQVLCYDPMDIFQIRIKGQGQLTKKIPSYCFLARSVNITPTMMHVATPAIETSNRIIRENVADADRFIRVKFTDEKTEGRLTSHGFTMEALFDRVKRALEQGIVVAGRYYVFLAFGNSQFRENSAYFYAPTESRSADDIRRALGTFDHIKTVAKFGARLGQCFSTTRAIKSIQIKLEKIPDIERNGFNFTDGVGKLSLFLAQMAAQELGLSFNDPPSLYQFRLAGCKGVLALDPALQGNVIQIRPSQYKFGAKHQHLEIIRASAFATAYFNRQLIIVLSTLGVPNYTFIRKQQDWINHLEKATQDESVALEKLQRNVDINQVSLTMAAMILDGFMAVREPFMMSLLHLWRAYNIKTLKEKARIFIEHGAFVLGCVDETATLRGHFDEPQSRINATREEKLATLPEIFLQVSDTEKKGFYKVITGVCILARNPSLHPGDIRVVRAVDVPALHHLRNVVVLPQTGDRDLANMCSGGDLDGDDYLVMWDEDCIPDTINEPPMDFTPDKPMELEHGITIKDLTDFFVTYMKNDSLGKIAVAHLAQADFNEDGVRDDKCLELARLHSQAVDYPKSGIPAVMERDLRPKKWPHFMPNKYRAEKQVYRSTKILGMLYDQVELVDFKPRYENRFDSRILNAFELDEAILQTAAMLKSQYDAAISRLMAKHGIRTEFEVWSVFVLAHNQEGRDYKFAEEFGQTVDAIKDQFREACREASRNALGEDDTNPATGRTDILPFVAAMYTVTAREMSDALQDCHKTKIVGGKEVPLRKLEPEEMPLMSFPWLFHIELGIIATGALRQPDLVPNQQYPKKAKRHAACREPGAAGIETELGITSVGDWLELEFGDLKPDKKEAEIGLSGGKSSTGTIQNEKQDKKPDGHSKDVGTDLSGQKSSRTSNEEAIRQDESDDEAFGPGLKEVKIPMSGSKASALDKLARLE